MFQEYDIANPFNEDTDFHCLSLRTKVVILNYLCDFRLDSANVETITSEFEANSLRIEPLGYDSNGSVYWYFFGTRLYREDFRKSSNKKGSERIWQVICFNEQDWQNLTNKFKNSKSRKETALHKILAEDFLPNIPVLFKAKEAERRRRYYEVNCWFSKTSRFFLFRHILGFSNVDHPCAFGNWSKGRTTNRPTTTCRFFQRTILKINWVKPRSILRRRRSKS